MRVSSSKTENSTAPLAAKPPPTPVNSLPNFTVFFSPVSSKSFVFAKAKFSQSKNDERRNVSGFVKVAFLFFFAVILGLKIVLTLPISEFNHCLKFATERSALKRCFQRLPAWVPVGSVPLLLLFWGKGMGSSEIVWGFLIQTGSTGTACLFPQRIEWHFLSSKN